jgi:hypothetical protein
MTRPPKPPIVHRLEQRRAQRSSDDVGAMFWAAVVAMVLLAGCIVVVGAR